MALHKPELKSTKLPHHHTRILNGIRGIKAQALDAFGISDSGLDESKDITNGDITGLVNHIKSALGFDGNDDAAKLFSTRSTQPFKTGTGTPWSAISTTEAQQSTKAFVEEKLRGCVSNNMPAV